jgi:hypothetical protein
MRIGRWVKLVAVFCVLLYAGLFVRHNNSVLANALTDGLFFQPGAICSVVNTGQDQSPVPAKSSQCPICMGAAPAVIILSDAAPVSDAPVVSDFEPFVIADVLSSPIAVTLPPSRAPPFTA